MNAVLTRHERVTTHAAARPVRVCFLIDTLSRAGTESQLLALIRELDRGAVEPCLVLLDGSDPASQRLEPSHCPVLRLGVKRLTSRAAYRAARRLRSFWREWRPDVLQVYFLDSAYFGVPLAKLCRVPRVVRVRNNLGYWLTWKHRLLNRLIGRLANVTLTNSADGKQALVAAEGLSPDRVAVIENGVDVERFAGFAPPFSGPTVRVGCVANLRPVKNIDGLMRAARLVIDRSPDVVFEVAGDGEQWAELERLHAELRLGERFILRGAVSDVPGFLRSVDVAVLPSHSEGMSNALLEYMAAGRAVVATAVGATPELVHDGETGLLVPPGNETALADATGRLIADAGLSQRLGAAARRQVEIDYSRDAMRRRFERFYYSGLEMGDSKPTSPG
jgi:glycosyltransferase involved in cell wall biosynthesis